MGHVELTGTQRPAPEATRAFPELIAHTAQAARSDADHKGLVLLVDELEAADPDFLRTIVYAWQELQASDSPVPAALLAAGLSHTHANRHPRQRFQYCPMRDLEPHETREAPTTSSAALGVSWATDALEAVVDRAQG